MSGQVSQGLKSSEAARKRAAIEMIATHEAALKRTARRYSLDAEDVDDAYQRALEIALTKAPTTDPRDLIRWTHTVVKHEALAVRHGRERLLAYSWGDDTAADPVAGLAATGNDPNEQAERSEEVARSREALRALKPAELRALSLLAAGHSYAEIGERSGFSQTKVNRVLAEGRDRFRGLLSSSEDGSRCRELRPLLSAFCDGEAGPRDSATVRDHLRACGRCRATMRTYRAAPRMRSRWRRCCPHRARCWGGRRNSSPASARSCPASAAAATRPRRKLPWPGGRAGRAWRRSPKLWPSAPGRREPPPAWRPACCRRLTWRPGTRSHRRSRSP